MNEITKASPEEFPSETLFLFQSDLFRAMGKDDGDKVGAFMVTEPAYKAFKYGDDGVTQWYGVTLSMEAQEVER